MTGGRFHYDSIVPTPNHPNHDYRAYAHECSPSEEALAGSIFSELMGALSAPGYSGLRVSRGGIGAWGGIADIIDDIANSDVAECIAADPGVQFIWEHRDWLIGAGTAALFRNGVVLPLMRTRGRQLRNFKGRPEFGRGLIAVTDLVTLVFLPAKVGLAAGALYVGGVAAGCAATSL